MRANLPIPDRISRHSNVTKLAHIAGAAPASPSETLDPVEHPRRRWYRPRLAWPRWRLPRVQIKVSLRASLIAMAVIIVACAAAATHLPWLWISHQNIAALAEQLNAAIIEDVNKQIEENFKSTEQTQQTVLEMLQTGIVDIDDRSRREHMMFAFLKANPTFSWVSFARENGDFYGAQRRDESTFRLVESHWDPARSVATRTEDYYASDGDAVVYTQTKLMQNDYFGPKRQWYQRAIATPDKPIWTDVYVFSVSNKPGINTAISYERDGKLVGVVSIAIELDSISRYLSGLKIAKGGVAFIVSRSGDLIAFTDPREVMVGSGGSDDNPTLKKLGQSWHPMLQLAKAAIDDNGIALDKLEGTRQLVQATEGGQRYFVTVAPTRSRDWVVGTLIPERDFLTKIYENMNRLALAIGAAVVIIALLAALVSRALLVRPLARMIEQTSHIERFELDAVRPVPSYVKELDWLSGALVRMAGGLASFRRYLPADLVHELMEQGVPAEVGGERRTLSILFMDLANFTGVTERLGHRVLPILGEYLSDMTGVLIGHHATIDKFIGDAVMAFWGAPHFNEEHSIDACRAALECIKRMEERRKLWAQQGRPDLNIRIGINTGRVVVGNIGSRDRLDYTVIGDPVNLASRLEGLNKVYGTRIIIGPSTYELAKYDIVARRLDHVHVKGKDETVAVYELLGIAEGEGDRTRLDWVIAYEEGIDLFHGGDPAGARERFEEAIRRRGEDAPSTRFLKLCDERLASRAATALPAPTVAKALLQD